MKTIRIGSGSGFWGDNLDPAIEIARHKVPKVILFQRPQAPATMIKGRDLDWVETVGAAKPAAMAEALEPLLGDTPARQAQLDGLEGIARALTGEGDIRSAGQVVAGALGP